MGLNLLIRLIGLLGGYMGGEFFCLLLWLVL